MMRSSRTHAIMANAVLAGHIPLCGSTPSIGSGVKRRSPPTSLIGTVCPTESALCRQCWASATIHNCLAPDNNLPAAALRLTLFRAYICCSLM